ncbi:MAG: hypothetical protein AB1589_28095 [Cyanobacteriota bacterium]
MIQEEPQFQIFELRNQYIKVVTQYLEVRPPFYWNLNPDPDTDKSQRAKWDINQYIDLIIYCTFADSYQFLDNWGYPYDSQNCYRLAMPVEFYIEKFKLMKNGETFNNIIQTYNLSQAAIQKFINCLDHLISLLSP